jgi:uncharacterized OB-fold protein
MERGVVYTETVIHAAPEAFLKDAPYQLALVSLDGGGRRTGRVRGERVKIGDAVQVVEVDPAGITWFAGATQSQSAIHP